MFKNYKAYLKDNPLAGITLLIFTHFEAFIVAIPAFIVGALLVKGKMSFHNP